MFVLLEANSYLLLIIFVVLTIISISYDNIVRTNVTADFW